MPHAGLCLFRLCMYYPTKHNVGAKHVLHTLIHILHDTHTNPLIKFTHTNI